MKKWYANSALQMRTCEFMKRDIFLILDNIRSKENVGSIFRTADGVGVDKIFLCGITPTPSVGNSKFQKTNFKQITNSRLRQSFGGHAKFQIQNQDKISKTALGAEKWVPWEHYSQTWRLLKKLRDDGLSLIALELTKNSKSIFEFRAKVLKPNFLKPMALVVGNEVKGISPKILKYCDEVVHIPMAGKKESLNVSVAAGVALYTILNS